MVLLSISVAVDANAIALGGRVMMIALIQSQELKNSRQYEAPALGIFSASRYPSQILTMSAAFMDIGSKFVGVMRKSSFPILAEIYALPEKRSV